jgi:hypothetical protein
VLPLVLVGCTLLGDDGDSERDGQVDAGPELDDGVRAAPGTEILGGGAQATERGWYAALDLEESSPQEAAAFYRVHLADLGWDVEEGTDSLTVIAFRGTEEPRESLRIDIVPSTPDVPGFVRIVAD